MNLGIRGSVDVKPFVRGLKSILWGRNKEIRLRCHKIYAPGRIAAEHDFDGDSYKGSTQISDSGPGVDSGIIFGKGGSDQWVGQWWRWFRQAPRERRKGLR